MRRYLENQTKKDETADGREEGRRERMEAGVLEGRSNHVVGALA